MSRVSRDFLIELQQNRAQLRLLSSLFHKKRIRQALLV